MSRITDHISPIKTLTHSLKLTFLIFPVTNALPVSPAISPCVSLVGIPKKLAIPEKILQDIILLKSIMRPTSPVSKVTIEEIPFAILKLIKDIIIIPKKLKIALKKEAFLKDITSVETTVVIAFGASVNPFIKIKITIAIKVK